MDLINQIDFKREVFDTQPKLPQNIQAIKLYTTQDYIIIEPNSKSLSIDTRLVINRNTHIPTTEPLNDKYLRDTPQFFSAFIGIISIKAMSYLIMVDKCTHHPLHPIYKEFFEIVSVSFLPLRDEQDSPQITHIKELLSKGFYFTYEKCEEIDRNEFMWNSQLCQPLIKNKIKNWDVLVIQGFIDSCQVYLDGKKVTIALIARRSIRTPGARLSQTGITNDGDVANYVLSEQIVSVANIKCSYKQIRGSVPVFWREKGTLIKKLELYGSDSDNSKAFEKHFTKLINQFKKILSVNLMNFNKQIEHDLITAYEYQIQQFNSENVKYIYYNFDEQTQGVDFHKIDQHILEIAPLLLSLQFDAEDLVSKQLYLSQQGIIRTNCLACLDRTNVYQSRIGLFYLEQQLKCMGIELNPKKSASLIHLFRQLWANHGDQISYLYSGTGSVHSSQIKEGTQSFFSILGSGMVPLNRFYRNNFSEHIRQESIMLILKNDEEANEFDAKIEKQLYLPFFNIEINDLYRLGYQDIFFKNYKRTPDGQKHIIQLVSKNININIQCYNSLINSYPQEQEVLKQFQQKNSNLIIKRIENKLCSICELGIINLNQLLRIKYEITPFTEQELLKLLFDLANEMKMYQKMNFYLNGINNKNIWFLKNKVFFDIVTHIPTDASSYPTIIKPDYMDPHLIAKIQQQENVLEKQDDLQNTSDLMTQDNKITNQEIEQCQVWILARIIYIVLFYPQPEQSNGLEIMLPNLNNLLEISKFVILTKLLKRMFRQDIMTSITTLDQLISELSILVPQQPTLIKIPEKPIIDDKYGIKELKCQIDLCRHFKQNEQGIQAINSLKQLQQELSSDDETQLQYFSENKK